MGGVDRVRPSARVDGRHAHAARRRQRVRRRRRRGLRRRRRRADGVVHALWRVRRDDSRRARAARPIALSGQGTAPARATIAELRKRGVDRIPTGPGRDAHLSFTVPGAVDAYLTLLETYGTRSVREVARARRANTPSAASRCTSTCTACSRFPRRAASSTLYPPGGDRRVLSERHGPARRRAVRAAGAGRHARSVWSRPTRKRGGDRLHGIAAARERFYRRRHRGDDRRILREAGWIPPRRRSRGVSHADRADRCRSRSRAARSSASPHGRRAPC